MDRECGLWQRRGQVPTDPRAAPWAAPILLRVHSPGLGRGMASALTCSPPLALHNFAVPFCVPMARTRLECSCACLLMRSHRMSRQHHHCCRGCPCPLSAASMALPHLGTPRGRPCRAPSSRGLCLSRWAGARCREWASPAATLGTPARWQQHCGGAKIPLQPVPITLPPPAVGM